jgi:RNA polymerase sigma-70 factor (ECF subfamily)
MGRSDAEDEADLLRRAVEEHEALAEIYRRYVRRVTAFAARRCTSADDVADVVAETFDRLLRSAHRYDPARGPVAAFVFSIAESRVFEQRRRAARQHRLRARLIGRDLLDEDDVARIDTALDAARSLAELEPALATLSTGEDEVLRLVADGLSPTEAARELGITANSARVRLHRARRHVLTHRSDTRPANDR